MARQRASGKTDGAGSPSHKPWGSERPLLNRIREQITPPLLLSIGLLAGSGITFAWFSWREQEREVQHNEAIRAEAERRAEVMKKFVPEIKGSNYEKEWDKWHKPNPVCQRANLKWKELVDCGDELIRKRNEFDALYRAGKLKPR